jgi:3-phenylpropionate/trans-cinnamate dioxygenase ferredoxin component
MTKQRLCKEEDLKLNEVRRFDVGEVPVALVRFERGYKAIHDVCSHQDFPLSDGEVWPDECALECLLHGSQFNMESGEPLTLPATESVKVYPVQIVDGEVEVDVS